MGVDQFRHIFRLQICFITIHCHPPMALHSPDISVIIPILNEAAELPGLLGCLAGQHGMVQQIILCDGGSSDDSLRTIRTWAECASCDITIVSSPRGRGWQMNAGVKHARSDLLLFLHADSRFARKDALCRAVTAFRCKSSRADEILAGRCALRFRRQEQRPSLAYTFYEAKARLKRSDCIRGDQGFMITRSDFDRLGGYDTSLPFLEDLRLADAVALNGRWMLLPVEIETSARRFEQEGLYERQVINAIIANAVATGWDEFFTLLPGLYRSASESGRLDLYPFLDGIRILLAESPVQWRRSFWHATGRHVSVNAWQLFFWLDVRSTFTKNLDGRDVHPAWLAFYHRYLEPFFRSACAGWLAQQAVKAWFRFMLLKGTSRTA